MFCYKCGQRLWEGRTACQSCGAILPGAAADAGEAGAAAARWSYKVTAYGLFAQLTVTAALGVLALHPYYQRWRGATLVEPASLITPLNVRDPSALVMAPTIDQNCQCPAPSNH